MVNALVAADWVIVPVRHAIFSLDGLADTIETLEGYTHLGGHTNGADAYRILFTMVDARKKKSAQYATGELATLEHQLFRTVIRDNDDLNQAQAAGLSIFHFSPHCHGAQDYFELTKEILAYEEARTQASKQANEHAPRSD